jgi:HK97 family phage major capsid protein
VKTTSVLALALVAVAALVGFAADPAAAATFFMLANAPLALDPEKIQAELTRISEQVKNFAEKAMKEISASGTMSTETRASVDKVLVQQGELQARLATAEQILAKYTLQGGAGSGKPHSWGEQFTQADGFEAFAAKASRGARFGATINAAVTESGNADLVLPSRVPGVVGPALRRLTVRDLLNWGRTTSNAVEFVKENVFTNSADVVSENPVNGKPESNITFTLDSAPVATIAHWIHASKQVLSDVPMLQSYIDGRLRHGLKLKEEAQLLLGSGTGLNISGLYTEATAYSQPAGVGVVADEQRLDRLRLALLQAELAEYNATGIVLHPVDWTMIELLKSDTEHQYLFANPHSITTPMIWGRPVVSTAAMAAGTYLVGAFSMGAQGWDREDINVTVSLEDRDNVIKNMVTILVEERLALTIYRPQAFVKGAFTGTST